MAQSPVPEEEAHAQGLPGQVCCQAATGLLPCQLHDGCYPVQGSRYLMSSPKGHNVCDIPQGSMKGSFLSLHNCFLLYSSTVPGNLPSQLGLPIVETRLEAPS